MDTHPMDDVTAELMRLVKGSVFGWREIAEAAGLSQHTVRSWCAGRREPNPEGYRKLAEGLDVLAERLLRTAEEIERLNASRGVRGYREYRTRPGVPSMVPEARQISASLRRMILERHGYRCCACESRWRLEIDHVIPVSRGGDADPSNLQVLCKPCNTSKGDRTMAEWLASLEGTAN